MLGLSPKSACLDFLDFFPLPFLPPFLSSSEEELLERRRRLGGESPPERPNRFLPPRSANPPPRPKPTPPPLPRPRPLSVPNAVGFITLVDMSALRVLGMRSSDN